ncbi:hypothetical protein [Teichococcus vastitatis]|uniref:Uncharacterized protein n=1 Tax=Teichococcus vastitatis TaxID=2307076 RepID=A0ABS9W3T8_9PROT|nr:hypothetical protein [Pseudoroseomonas vastitatis]MCI0753944.1 hypothetical protein [Pseudoroseomonas vastitatis]
MQFAHRAEVAVSVVNLARPPGFQTGRGTGFRSADSVTIPRNFILSSAELPFATGSG